MMCVGQRCGILIECYLIMGANAIINKRPTTYVYQVCGATTYHIHNSRSIHHRPLLLSIYLTYFGGYFYRSSSFRHAFQEITNPSTEAIRVVIVCAESYKMTKVLTDSAQYKVNCFVQ